MSRAWSLDSTSKNMPARATPISLGAVGREELRHRQSCLELRGIDAHHATSLASGDGSIHPARRRYCDSRLKVKANQVIYLFGL
ncbi:hypothetical protein, partial [Xanthomonas axonopodis]|uniref:hypothetical protein n=1 Tax=Xanthomonas axonopodis TaxID=53413 RepID=UPI00214C228E